MSKLKNSISTKVVSAFVGVMMAVVLTGGAALPAQAATVEELQAQIAALLSQITALQSQLSGSTSGSASAGVSYTFTKNLTRGDTGADVKALQQVLNSNAATRVAASGAGSPGLETMSFGSLTHAAVVKFQELYASEILAPVGLTKGTGFVGASTRAKLNALATGSTSTGGTTTGGDSGSTSGTTTGGTTTGGTTTTTTGGSLTVGSATQPSNSLAPQNAARVPFTRVTFTAGSADVTVNSVVVERGGLADDDAFSGIVLLDENGIQLGVEKTLNSNHRATVGDAFVVKAGTSRTMTIAGNMTAVNTTNAGQVATLSLVGVNSSATVSGSLPITGAAHTINASLSIGSVTLQRGPLDPNAARTKEVGSKDYTFSSIKVTAGSVEKVRVMSVRWNQSGSASASDLKNVKTIVNGTAYDAVISSDGKYYTSVFGTTGILVDKGASIEISVKGDVDGGSARTIAFDLYRNTDLHVTGDLYGYGIAAPTSGSSGLFGSTNPWFDASVVTVSAGSLAVEKDTSVSAQNIAVNLSDVPLGGFIVEVKGEPVSVGSMIFELGLTGSGGTAADITNITLYDANGVAVAGPADGSDSSDGQVTLSDTVEFPIGRNKYVLKGKLGTDFTNDQTVTASTTPSGWSTVQGGNTGDTVTPTPSTAVTGNTMTVKSAALKISVSASPIAQTVVAGVTNFTFAEYQLDATNSGEDLQLSTFLVDYEETTATETDSLNNCKLYDGTTALQSGSNVINPTADDDDFSFTLDNPLVITKGTVKNLALKCAIVGGGTGTYRFGYNSSASPTVTGRTSGQSATITEVTSVGQLMTLSTGGSLTIEEDASSPGYRLLQAGTTGNTLTVLKLRASTEDIALTRLGLSLTNSASSSPQNLTKVTLHDGVTGAQVGEAVFTGSDYTATSTLVQGDFVIPKDTEKTLIIKGDLAAIGTSQAGTQGALIAIDYDYISTNTAHTRGIGQASGSTINSGSTSDTASTGARIFKAYPVVTMIPLSNATLTSGNDKSVYRFSIQAVGGSIGIAKFTFRLATSSATSKADMVDNLNVRGFTDSGFSQTITGVQTDGSLTFADLSLARGWASASTDLQVAPATSANASTTIQIPAGATRYFEVVADVDLAGAGTTYNMTTQLQGDSAYIPKLRSGVLMATSTYAYSAGNSQNDFLWSPNATTTSVLSANDWTNGYGVQGLPATNLTGQTLSD